MLDFLLNLVGTTSVVSALLVVAATNTPRSHRVQQTWLPVISFAYGAVALVVLYRLNDSIESLLTGLSGLLPWTPPTISGVGLYLLENILLIVVFAILKLVLRPIFRRLFAGGRSIAQFTAARIYEFDPDYQLWFVEVRHARLRDFYRVLYWASMGLAVLLIATAATFPTWPGFSAIAFPALAVLIIGEFFFAIDGVTRAEYSHSLYGERDVSRRVGNFGPLRQILRETFPNWVRGDGVHLASMASLNSGYQVGEMKRSASPSMRLAGTYFDRLRTRGHDVDTNLVSAVSDLMSGRSVLFANPFFKDLTTYLPLAVYHELLEGRRCLIVAGRDSQTTDLTQWISDGLADISGVPHLWRVRPLDAFSKEGTDVGVLRTADVHNLDVLSNNDEFFREVGLMILAEPSAQLATGQLGLELVYDRCSRDRPVTVAAFDGNHDGLVDTLSHLTKSDITEVVASPLPQGASSELIWHTGGPHMHTRILPGVSRFLGSGTEIAAVALKYQVRRVHWIGGETFPVVDMRWIAQQYFSAINQFADLELSQDALAESLVAEPNPWSLPQSDNYFLVVEDEMHNVYESVRQFATRATRAGFINVLCDDYLLRDYMVSLREIFSVDPKAIPSIVPDYARTERNVTLRLLLALRGFGVSGDALRKQLDLPNWTTPLERENESGRVATAVEPRVIQEFRRLVDKHTGAQDVPLAVAGSRLLATPPDAAGDAIYVLLTGSEVDTVLDRLGPAYFFVEDDEDGSNVIGSILMDHVYQALLPGQHVTYGGKYYEVQGISTDTAQSRVILRRAADHIRERSTYRQLRSYRLTNLREADRVGAVRSRGQIRVARIVADIEVETEGYLQASSRSALGDARMVSVSGIPIRRYPNKASLRLELPGASAEVRNTIAVLLTEAFITLFPRSHQYIAVASDTSDPNLRALIPTLISSDGPSSEDGNVIYIVEDSLMDLGLVAAVERNWERIFEIITDYLDWNSELPQTVDPPEFPVDGVALFPDRPAKETEPETSWTSRLLKKLGRLRGRPNDATSPTTRPVGPEPSKSNDIQEPGNIEEFEAETSTEVSGTEVPAEREPSDDTDSPTNTFEAAPLDSVVTSTADAPRDGISDAPESPDNPEESDDGQ